MFNAQEHITIIDGGAYLEVKWRLVGCASSIPRGHRNRHGGVVPDHAIFKASVGWRTAPRPPVGAASIASSSRTSSRPPRPRRSAARWRRWASDAVRGDLGTDAAASASPTRRFALYAVGENGSQQQYQSSYQQAELERRPPAQADRRAAQPAQPERG